MTFHKRRMQIKRGNRTSLWLDVFSAAVCVLFLVAAVSGAIYRFM